MNRWRRLATWCINIPFPIIDTIPSGSFINNRKFNIVQHQLEYLQSKSEQKARTYLQQFRQFITPLITYQYLTNGNECNFQRRRDCFRYEYWKMLRTLIMKLWLCYEHVRAWWKSLDDFFSASLVYDSIRQPWKCRGSWGMSRCWFIHCVQEKGSFVNGRG